VLALAQAPAAASQADNRHNINELSPLGRTFGLTKPFSAKKIMHKRGKHAARLAKMANHD